MKSFLHRNWETLKKIKVILAIMLGAMIVIDIILVALGPKGWPTFSKVVLETQDKLIWLTFLFGGLVAKIFYNRKVDRVGQELSGFSSFMVIVGLLFLLGYYDFVPKDVPNEIQLAFLLSGGILAYRVWPQYVNPEQKQ
jgi:hypothetical protein